MTHHPSLFPTLKLSYLFQGFLIFIIIILLSYSPRSFMIYSKQLYQTNTFNVPQIGTISLEPFPKHPKSPEPDPQRDHSLFSVFSPNQQQFKSHCSAYLSQFQQLCAKENLYPFMLGVGCSKLAVVCRECIMLCDWQLNDKGQLYQGGGEIVKLDKMEKVKFNEVPTTLKVGKNSLFVGYQTGRIAQYLFRTKSWEGVNDDLEFPVMQIHVIKEEQNKESSIMAIDSAGNLAHITYSHKTFMDKIIKTLTSLRWISFLFRNKKREKIKKIFQSLISKEKEGSDTQGSSSETVAEPQWYYYNKFHCKVYNQQVIVTVYRKNKLEVMVLSQGYELLKSIEVDCHRIKEKSGDVTFLELGEGGFENSNIRHNILVIGVNSSVLFYRLVQVEDSYQVLLISQIDSQQALMFGCFISNSLLMVANKRGISLQTVSGSPKKVINYDQNKFSYVDFFIDEQKMQMDKKLFNQHLLATINDKASKDSKFLCLQGKRLIVGSIFSWESILYQEIQAEHWERALLCYQQIYNGGFKFCCGINQELSNRGAEMSSICRVIVMGYLYSKLPVIKQQDQHSSFIANNAIYFLLKCDQSQLLFQEIVTFFVHNQLEPILLSELFHYIEEKNGYGLRIPYMSQKILNKVIRKYKASQEEYILERLFMNFDLTQMQKLILLTTCLKEELYQSLIYICCEQRDYITPIIKLCGIRITNPEKQPRIAEIIYWYLSECLQGRMTDYGNQADYINMLAILINFIFIPSSLEMLLQTSHQYLIQIINMFFQPVILRHILQNEEKFFMRKGEEGDPIFQESCLREYKLYEKMLSILIRVIQASPLPDREKYQLQLNKFLTSIMVKNQFPFLSTIKIKIILFYINHPYLFMEELQANLTEENEIFMNGHLMRLLDSLIRSISEKCLYIREKAKEDGMPTNDIQELMARSKSHQLTKILQAIIISHYNMQFSQTKCYIYHQLGNYAEVMETYLKMTNKKIRLKIYQYLDNNIRQYERLTQEFLKYMISLLHIDEHKTSRLIQKLREDWVDHQEIIDKLVDYPTIQLNYIEKVIQNRNEKSKKLLLRHLQIVLREKGEQVQQFINKIDYPLQQAFRMCEQGNNRKGKAFILIKSGRNMQGVLIIAEIFLQSIQEYLRGLFKKIQYGAEKKERIMSQLQVVLNTCYKEWTIDNDRGEQIWEKITELIFKKLNVNNIDSQHIPDSIRSILNQIVTALLSTMLEQVSTDFFLNRFAKTFGGLPIRIFTQAHSYIYQRLEFTFTLQKLNKDLLQSQEISLWYNLMQTIYQGHICNLLCHICNHPVTLNERMVSYQCQHIFHEQCYYQVNNKKNKNELCPLCYNSLDSYMICNDQKLPRYRLEIDQQELLRHKISKMNYYDRMTRMEGMEGWDKYEEFVDI